MVLGAGSRATKTMQSFICTTEGHEQSLHTEQKDRGVTGDFLMLVTKDWSHEYLKWCHQMKSLKVWQVTSKLDEKFFFFINPTTLPCISASNYCLDILFLSRWQITELLFM